MSDPRQPGLDGPTSRYRIGEQLAVGGMGVIHRALDTLGGREVAYKRLRVVSESKRPRLTTLFRREYETLVSLHHPNTVQVYDYGFDAHGPYYTMELLSGHDLSERAPLAWQEACRVLRDVASALALVHARRLIHRDLSPNNVRLTDDGTAKLLDFGALSPFGRPAEVAGTPPFMAPELLDGEPLDQRTDLFSLGALAYWTLTGRLCFPVSDLGELPRAWSAPVPPPSAYASGLPDELDELVLSLLQRAQSARPPSTAHVVERLTTIAKLPPERNERDIALGYLRRPPLVERGEVVASLSASIERAADGRGSVVLLEAAPGLGRSALLDRIAVDAQLAGLSVLRGEGGHELVPYAFAEQLVQEGARWEPEPTREHTGAHALASEALDASPRSTIDVVEQRAREAERLRTRLLTLAERGPLALLVDEAHRIDRESLVLLASMAEEVAQRPLLVVISMRAVDDAADPLVRATLQRAAALRPVLAPLSEAGVTELVQTTFGDVSGAPRLARVLSRESRGNPGLVMQLLAKLVMRGQIRYASGTFLLPADLDLAALGGSMQDAGSMLSQEEGAALRLVRVLALHHGTLTRSVLTRASGMTPAETLRALERLARSGAVLEIEQRYHVGSDLLRASIARTVDATEARHLHAALADAIAAEEDGSASAKIAAGHHLMQSGPEHALRGADRVAEASRACGYEATAFTAMVPYLEEALAVYRAHGRSDEACLDLLVPLSFLGFYGDLAAQRRYLEPTLRALAERSGFGFARRWDARLGPRLALFVGLTLGALRAVFRRGYSFTKLREDFERLCMVVGSSVAAAASAGDDRDAFEIVSWLAPARTLPARHPLAVSYRFALATAEIAAGFHVRATERYRKLIDLLRQPVRGIVEARRLQLYYGSVHGLAQVYAERGDARALTLAEELERGSAFYAPYAETVRVGYAANRGDYEALERSRARAEALVLRGGVAWSALVILSVRSLYAYALTGDSVGLARVVAELARFKDASASLRRYAEMGQAHLDTLRGEHARAISVYERLLDESSARQITYTLDCSLYAWALLARGEYARAKDVCEHALALAAREGRELDDRDARILSLRLAMAEAALGRHDRAVELLDEQLRQVEGNDNPINAILHCERATVALVSGDLERFERHAKLAEGPLRASNNPWLIAQFETLRARATRAGLGARTPSALAEDSLDDFGETYLESAEPANDTTQPAPARQSSRS